MQEIAVEEDDISGIHLDVSQLEHLLGLLHPLRVRPGLLAAGHVVDPPQGVAGLQDLEAAVVFPTSGTKNGAIEPDNFFL